MEGDKPLLEAEDLFLDDPKNPGKKLHYMISKISCVDGRRLACCYPMSALPKIGDYDTNEKLWFLMMTYVEKVADNGFHVRLKTPDLIDNHVPDFEVGMAIEKAMMVKNTSFFRDGRSWSFLDDLTQMLLSKATEILTRSSAQSSPPASPPSTN